MDEGMSGFIQATLRSNARTPSQSIQLSDAVSRSRITSQDKPRQLTPLPDLLAQTFGGGGSDFPFKITGISGAQPKYIVSANSSIVNGINGDAFSITGLGEERPISESKFIVAEAEVTANPFAVSPTGFTIKEVSEDNLDEVFLEEVDFVSVQKKLRLVIGRVHVKPSDNDPEIQIVTAVQAVASSFRTAVAFHNGVPVYILQAAPSHKSVLTLEEE